MYEFDETAICVVVNLLLDRIAEIGWVRYYFVGIGVIAKQYLDFSKHHLPCLSVRIIELHCRECIRLLKRRHETVKCLFMWFASSELIQSRRPLRYEVVETPTCQAEISQVENACFGNYNNM